MVKEFHIRLFFIPLLGILIPFASHIITYSNYSFAEIAAAHLYFIFSSYCIWTGSNMAHKYLRKRFTIRVNIFFKIAGISLISTLYSSIIGGILTFLWLTFSGENFTWAKLLGFTLYTSLAVTLFTLMYEVLFLNTEKEQHIKIADELDKERAFAETAVLRNELDPHFIFNSLTTLNQLISSNPDKAALYNNHLAQVYKYVLRTKNKESVPLADEMQFIEDYFSLLLIRYGNKLDYATNLEISDYTKYNVVPCALQMLIENAIKHNEFSMDQPLKIRITLNGEYLKISNNIMPKPFLLNSTETGLKNLRLRYKLISTKEILIQKNETTYTVALPLLFTIKPLSHA